MKKVDFTYTGGFPFTQRTHSDMQSAYLEILTALLRFLKVPATGSHVIFGCETDGTNIAPGMMYIDGDLCSFVGSAGNNTTKIAKLVTTEDAPFFGGANNPVYINTTAVVDGAGVELGQFTRHSDRLVYDANYNHTDNNFTAALLAKLNGIAAGAEVNVKTNWNETNSYSDAYLENKPEIENILYSGIALLGDFPNDVTETREIIFPTVGTTNYKIRLSFKSNSVEGLRGHDIIAYSTADYKHDRFDLLGREFVGSPQNLELFYDIIAR